MRVCHISLLLAGLSARSALAAVEKHSSTETKPLGQRKLEKVLAAAASNPTYTLPLVDTNFTRYALSKPRPYYTLALFTALGERFSCDRCQAVHPHFEAVASSYARRIRGPGGAEAAAAADAAAGRPAIAFAVVDFDSSMDAFKTMKLGTAPHLFLFPPDVEFSQKNVPLAEKEDIVSLLTSGPEALHAEIRRRTGISFPLVRDTYPFKWLAAVISIAVGMAVHFIVADPGRAVRAACYWRLWLLVSIAAYAFGVGGFVYCIIRQPRTHSYVQNPDPAAPPNAPPLLVLFSQGSRDQNWYEGAIIAPLYLVMSGALALAARAPTWRRAPFFVRGTAALAAATLFVYAFSLFMELYQLKTKYYRLWGEGESGVMPAFLAEPFSGPVKKSHGGAKRAARLLTLWLNDYTTFASFRNKFRVLGWDYLVRWWNGQLDA